MGYKKAIALLSLLLFEMVDADRNYDQIDDYMKNREGIGM